MRTPVWVRFFATCVIALAVIVSTFIFSGAIVRARGADEMIRVTGSAKKPIRSDLILWSGNVSYLAPTVAQAYAAVKAGSQKVTTYLTQKGIKAEEIQTSAITTTPQYSTITTPGPNGSSNSSQKLDGYVLSQTINVKSEDVDRVSRVSREVTDLIASGVSFSSNEPQYLYTKLSDEKVAILGEAAKDARRRAEEIAKASGSSLGEVRFARMSPLQITPQYSTEVTYDGQNDTTSLNKTITAIVTIGYAVR